MFEYNLAELGGYLRYDISAELLLDDFSQPLVRSAIQRSIWSLRNRHSLPLGVRAGLDLRTTPDWLKRPT